MPSIMARGCFQKDCNQAGNAEHTTCAYLRQARCETMVDVLHSGARTAAPAMPYGAKAGSVRSKQSIGWAKKAANAPSSAAGFDDGMPVSKTRRIIVYVIGGITHRQASRVPASSWQGHL